MTGRAMFTGILRSLQLTVFCRWQHRKLALNARYQFRFWSLFWSMLSLCEDQGEASYSLEKPYWRCGVAIHRGTATTFEF
ncbi:hypothetical protein B0H16DRAFT_905994 [Mycena metata]|uniref:Uncharacterized protein n=1 Tax=Mycena metata TaxID=1033252 RepID=A0AAD7N791_9AGAR|nr:hypothetical protein B0H16DRAFT_905994 [Mycena metata]